MNKLHFGSFIGHPRAYGAIAAAAVLLAACGGGGSSGQPKAKAPAISGPMTLVLNQDTSSTPQAFQLSDADTPAESLEIMLATSDPELLPLDGLVVEGTGAARTLSVTPSRESTGSATVTVTVRDPGGLSSATTLAVTVNPVLLSFRSLTNDTFQLSEDSPPTQVSGVTVEADADEDAQAFDALLQ